MAADCQVASRMRSQDDLERFLQTHGVEAELLLLDQGIPTVELAAQAMGTSSDRIVKTLLFYMEGRPLLVLAAGSNRVDLRALAKHFGIGRKKVRMAEPDQVLQETGYPVGALPPFGHRRPLPAIMDGSVPAYGIIYAGGGSEHALLRLTAEELRAATSAEPVHVTAESGAAGS